MREAMHIVSAMQHLSKVYGYALNMQGEVERERLRIMMWSGWCKDWQVHLNKYPEFDGEPARKTIWTQWV